MVQTEADAGVLSGYSDSDWASDVTTRRSTSGYCIFHGKHLVEAGSASQHTIALSSGEAEFYACGRVCASILMVSHLMDEMGLLARTPTV